MAEILTQEQIDALMVKTRGLAGKIKGVNIGDVVILYSERYKDLDISGYVTKLEGTLIRLSHASPLCREAVNPKNSNLCLIFFPSSTFHSP